MAEEAAPAAKDDVAASGASAQLRDRYHVYPESPLPDLDSPNAQAFLAEDRKDAARPLFALVCRSDLPPRTLVMRTMKGVQGAGIMQLVEWGVMPWPPSGRKQMVVVYDRPQGGRVMTSLTAQFRRIDEFDVVRRAIAPLVAALKEINTRGVTHRAIRPTNMFWMEKGERLAFGDCVTGPPALDQPAVFETIESGLCHRAGRGSGSFSNDLYSFGVSLVMLMLGRNPVAGYDDDTILRLKIAQGSYGTLVGEERLPIAVIEVLRGLLCDDEDERWTMDGLDLWLSGRRMSPLQPRLEKRAARGFSFSGKEYITCRDLSYAMARNHVAAAQPILDGKLELWLRRSLEDKERPALVTAALRTILGATDKRNVNDILVARVAMLLDHSAPIRYKGLNILPDGFGPMLALLMAEKLDLKLYAETILFDLPKHWFETRQRYNPEASLLDQHFKELKSYLTQTQWAAGMERCLYEMNESLPCQSALVIEDYIIDVREVVPAVDNAAKKADHKSWPMDRHLAAFIAARANFDVSRQIAGLNDTDKTKQLLSLLSLFALLQWRAGMEPAYNLAQWIGTQLEPVVKAYHSRDIRKNIEKELARVIKGGNLVDLYHLVDSPDERQKDNDGFHMAQNQYAAAEAEIRKLEAGRKAREEHAIRAGRQTASLASVLIALLTITITVIVTVW